LLLKGISIVRLGLASNSSMLTPFSSPRKARPPSRSSYRHHAVGGFGTIEPEPSSGGRGWGAWP